MTDDDFEAFRALARTYPTLDIQVNFGDDQAPIASTSRAPAEEAFSTTALVCSEIWATNKELMLFHSLRQRLVRARNGTSNTQSLRIGLQRQSSLVHLFRTPRPLAQPSISQTIQRTSPRRRRNRTTYHEFVIQPENPLRVLPSRSTHRQ